MTFSLHFDDISMTFFWKQLNDHLNRKTDAVEKGGLLNRRILVDLSVQSDYVGDSWRFLYIQ
jgi:hypothetical protein